VDKDLVEAARYGMLDLAKALVENGAGVTADNNYALRVAASEGYLEIVKILIKTSVNNNEILGYAAENGHTEVVKYLKSQTKERAG